MGFEVGDIIEILECEYQNKRYVKYVIEEILNKDLYNMYLCKSIKCGYKTTFVDMDLNKKERSSRNIKIINSKK